MIPKQKIPTGAARVVRRTEHLRPVTAKGLAYALAALLAYGLSHAAADLWVRQALAKYQVQAPQAAESDR